MNIEGKDLEIYGHSPDKLSKWMAMPRYRMS